VLRGHEGYVYFVAFSPDGSLLASSEWAGNVRLWDPRTAKALAALSASCPHGALGFTPDGTHLVAYETDPYSRPQQHERGTGVLKWTPMTEEEGLREFNNAMRPLAWDTVSRAQVALPTLETGQVADASGGLGWPLDFLRVVAGGAKATDYWHGQPIASSFDRTRLAHGRANGQIDILDMATGRRVRQLSGPKGRVKAVAFSPDGARLVSGNSDGVICVWDLATGSLLATSRGHAGAVYSVSYHPDGRRIASGGADGSIVIWQAESLEPLLTLRGHTSYVHAVAFSPDGTLLASGSGDGTVRLWDSLPTAERWGQTEREDSSRLKVPAP
jgi:WD40 repeat protein